MLATIDYFDLPNAFWKYDVFELYHHQTQTSTKCFELHSNALN